ncbi:MAG: glycosyltransferase [Pseudomonadota bacterium]
MARPLLIAEAANPEWVSVPLVGWSLARAIQLRTGAHIATQIRNREAFLRAGLVEGTDFTAIDTEWVLRPVWKAIRVLRMGEGKGWTVVTAFSSLFYPVFERTVWRELGNRIRSGEFSVVHRITPLTPTANSLLAGRAARAGIPFVVGPLNGGVPWPKEFRSEQRQEREYLAYVRSIYKLSPSRASMLRHASVLIAGSRHTGSEIPGRYARKIAYIPENAIDPKRFNKCAAQDISGPLRGAFVGRLVPYKGCDMLLDAAAPLIRSGMLKLDIIGDGPMKESLQAQAKALHTEGGVTFHGWKNHGEVQDILSNCNLLTFPSVREFGGGVVLEAMALGVVPVIVDYAGPAELVDDGLGYKVPLGTRQEVTQALSETLLGIVRNPSPLPGMAAAARARVAMTYTWDAKADQILEIYDWLASGQPGLIPGFDPGNV